MSKKGKPSKIMRLLNVSSVNIGGSVEGAFDGESVCGFVGATLAVGEDDGLAESVGMCVRVGTVLGPIDIVGIGDDVGAGLG